MVSPLALRLQAFTKLSKDDRAAIDRVTGSVRQIPARNDIVREGDKPRAVNLVLEGWACRYKTLPDGRRQIVSLFLPGDLCDMNIFILKEMDHNIGAVTAVRVAEIGREQFEGLTLNFPRITQALWWDTLVTMAIQREWTMNVGQRDAYERISHLLVELFIRLRTVGLTDGIKCDFPLTQTDIADATGLTSVHVNRTLQDLRRDGMIQLERRTLTIPDLERLKQVAMFNDNYLHLEHEGAHLDAND